MNYAWMRGGMKELEMKENNKDHYSKSSLWYKLLSQNRISNSSASSIVYLDLEFDLSLSSLFSNNSYLALLLVDCSSEDPKEDSDDFGEFSLSFSSRHFRIFSTLLYFTMSFWWWLLIWIELRVGIYLLIWLKTFPTFLRVLELA